MKTARIGIIGGTSFEATARYCSLIAKECRKKRKGYGCITPDLVTRSLNSETINALLKENDWGTIKEILIRETRQLINGDGCKCIALASNTLHKVAPDIKDAIDLHYYYDRSERIHKDDLIDINDCIAERLQEIGARRILLLGAKPIMTEKCMKQYLSTRYDIEVMGTRRFFYAVNEIDRIICEELRYGTIKRQSKEYIMDFINQFIPSPNFPKKPDAIVLASVELGMLIKSKNINGIPLVDSAEAHASAIVKSSLSYRWW